MIDVVLYPRSIGTSRTLPRDATKSDPTTVSIV